MGNFMFSMKMLKKEYKKSVVYTLTLGLTISITLLFFNIINNPHLMDSPQQIVTWYLTEMPFSTMLSFLIIVFCAFMIMFANNFYVSRKTKEIAIMTMSGSSFLKITSYLFYQNIVLTMIAFIIGIVFGSGFSMCVNQLIYSYIGYNGTFFYIPMSAIFDTIICVVSILFAQLVYISGFVYRKDISFLLSQENTTVLKDERIIKLHPVLYVLCYGFGIVSLALSYTPISSVISCFIGAMGISGMIKYQFPGLFSFFKKKKFMANKLWLISLSNLYYSLSRACMLINIYAVSCSVMISIVIMQQSEPREFVTAIIGLLTIMILLLASIVYKFLMEATTRKMFYYNLYKMGYSYQQLKDIIKQEVIMFYMILISLPLVIILLALIQALLHGDVTVSFIILMLLIIFIPLIIACLLTYFTYKNHVLKVLEEGVHYE